MAQIGRWALYVMAMPIVEIDPNTVDKLEGDPMDVYKSGSPLAPPQERVKKVGETRWVVQANGRKKSYTIDNAGRGFSSEQQAQEAAVVFASMNGENADQ